MKKKVLILIVSLIGITGIIIGVSYAFFSASGVQETANTFTSGCLSISLTNESTSINLTNAYPITDIEGLETTSYDFTVTNNCSSATNYQINLESLNEQANSLNADYIKVSLSSDTVDNVISTLSSNTSLIPSISNAYKSYNLYTDTLNGNEEKTYHLKIWVDYEATIEQAANKTYTSKINVIANPETTIVDTLEAQFSLSDTILTANLTNNVTSANYCTTTDNICIPNTSVSISNNSYDVDLSNVDTAKELVSSPIGTLYVETASNQMVCTQLNGTSKVICSNPEEIGYDELVADNTVDNNLRYIGSDPNNYVYFNCDDYDNPSSDTCELWRIIGVMNNMETASGTTESLVKLIRSESIGSYSWDNKPSGTGSSTSEYGSNDWSDSALQIILNSGAYWNRISGTCPNGMYGATTNCDFSTIGLKERTKEMVEEVIWKLGGIASYTSSSNGLASHFYEYERGTEVYEGRPIEWSGKVGLMYPSDYGYATSGGETTSREVCLAAVLNSWSSDCYNNDWLNDGANHWTLTSNLYNSNNVFIVASGILGHTISIAPNLIDVNPSIYLKSNITITGGNGSESNPYTLNF